MLIERDIHRIFSTAINRRNESREIAIRIVVNINVNGNIELTP